MYSTHQLHQDTDISNWKQHRLKNQGNIVDMSDLNHERFFPIFEDQNHACLYYQLGKYILGLRI